MYVIRCTEDERDTVTIGVHPRDAHLPALMSEAMNMIESIAAQTQHQPDLDLWRHVKTGGLYAVICEAVREHDLEPLTVYKSVNGDNRVWARPSAEFMDGRFEFLGVAPHV